MARTVGDILARGFMLSIAALKSGLAAPHGCCRFTPTCSEYAVECFHHHSIPVAVFRAVWRVLRCNPLSRGGYDPVLKPERFSQGE